MGVHWPGQLARWFPRKHDVILFYAKDGKRASFNRDAVRVPYTRVTGTGHNSLSRGNRTDEEVKELEERYAKRGKTVEGRWADIPSGGHIPKGERVGYRTQKPLAMYERIIRASSNRGDMVLDPFAGSSTTLIAAEILGRQWVGIDLWNGAYDIVRRRMEDNRQLLADPNPTIHYAAEPPVRTDDGGRR